MNVKSQRYKATLKGIKSAEFYINKLRTNSSLKVMIAKEEDSFRIRVINQVKKIADRSNIEAEISERERKLKWNVPDLVKKTAVDIHRAYKAEQIVEEGRLSLLVPQKKKGATAEAILTIKIDADPIIREICDHYAYNRILKLSTFLDMIVDGNVFKL